jgi:hypothetical protein
MRTPEPPGLPADPGAPVATPDGERPAEKRASGPSEEMEPPGEIGGHTISSDERAKADEERAASADEEGATGADDMPVAAACPDLEDIAAFLDGTLPAGQRARLTEHLASCESCYEIFAGAARLLEDSREPEAAPAAPPRPFEPRHQPRAVVPLRWWGAAAALAALLAATAGVLVVRWRSAPEVALSTERLAQTLEGNREVIAQIPWQGRIKRGGSPEEGREQAIDQQFFRLGVRFLDLRLALAGNNREGAQDTLRRLGVLLDENFYVPLPDVRNSYRQLNTALQHGAAPASLLGTARALEEKGFEGAIEPRFVALGRWTEACRLAGLSGQAGLFHDRATRRLLDEVLAPAKDAGDLGSPAATAALREIQAAVATRHPDPAGMHALCQDLLYRLDSD